MGIDSCHSCHRRATGQQPNIYSTVDLYLQTQTSGKTLTCRSLSKSVKLLKFLHRCLPSTSDILQQNCRINSFSRSSTHPKMQMRTCGHTCIARHGNYLTGTHVVSYSDQCA